MLITPINTLTRNDILSESHRGVVVDNLDPKQRGRIKVQIPNIFEGTPSELPWVYQEQPAGFGGSSEAGLLNVPIIGSQVTVEFPDNDIYFPVYVGTWTNNSTLLPEMRGGQSQVVQFTILTGTVASAETLTIHGVVVDIPDGTSDIDAAQIVQAANYSSATVIQGVRATDNKIQITYSIDAGAEAPSIVASGPDLTISTPVITRSYVMPVEAIGVEGYPNIYGFKDENGNMMRINKYAHYAEFVHETGSYVRMLADGTIQMYSAGDYIEVIDGNKTSTIKGNHVVSVDGNQTEDISGIATKDASIIMESSDITSVYDSTGPMIIKGTPILEN